MKKEVAFYAQCTQHYLQVLEEHRKEELRLIGHIKSAYDELAEKWREEKSQDCPKDAPVCGGPRKL